MRSTGEGIRGDIRKSPGFVTIATPSHLAHARVMVESLRRQHPEAEVLLVLVDRFDSTMRPAWPGVTVVTADQLDIPRFSWMSLAYDAFELCNALKPYAIRHARRMGSGGPILYLDADMWVMAPLDLLIEELTCGSVIITPHATTDLPEDGNFPSWRDSFLFGIFNAGLLGVGGISEGDDFLRWWAGKLERWCLREPERGLFVDQRFIDAVSAMFPAARIFRHRGFNVGHYNFHERPIQRDASGWNVGRERIHVFHATQVSPEIGGFPEHPFRIASSGLIRELAAEYCALLREAGWSECRNLNYPFGRFHDDSVIRPETRRAFRESNIVDPNMSNLQSLHGWQRDIELKAQVDRFIYQVFGRVSRRVERQLTRMILSILRVLS